eukprot:CAMPEP_0176346604 /NCGR_PEP_ID=MMETSP0126-20121128/6356_1 /TAXON_ID=141414 ORGANISM="Strombidinopsis acuminatum, Strain SPMC142" /NCGR_SAMPLE_ID=MMETSP0126 /ASSEMBLY_ACC=CAM_ASM_000229 /LENGTH=89 /DNA_ID=CAMNT_0017694211 /DNA_START=373 /DNA_END=642 /DNA_ORIENTATION=+
MAEKTGDPKAIEKAKANISKAPDSSSAYNTREKTEVNNADKTANSSIQKPDAEITEEKPVEAPKRLPKPGEKWDLATVELPHPDLIFQY